MFCDLETERLRLQCVSPEHRAFLYRQFSDAEITRYLFDAEPYQDISEADELIAFYTCPPPRAQHRWILISKENGEMIGTCGFHCWNRGSGRAEIGYDLQKAYWGRGLMTEAVTRILEFAKDEMRVTAIHAHIFPQNIRSAALAERLGFLRQEKTVNYCYRGENLPHFVYTYYTGIMPG